MIDPKQLCAFFRERQIDFYTGVPDSTLSNFTDELVREYGLGGRHIVAHNEGGAVALCCGHYIATGRAGLVYMQNSGIGNAANPIISLADPLVYGIPVVYCVGWRGEPGGKDEPQHAKQGAITLEMLSVMGIETCVVNKDDDLEALETAWPRFEETLSRGGSVAYVFARSSIEKRGSLDKGRAEYTLSRENAVGIIASFVGESGVIVSTTGKLSRELFERREAAHEGHERDFLTVGSMGHASMIALGIAHEKPDTRVWCLDGDGAALMHMGAMAVVGERLQKNMVHVIIDNGMHESVGGMPVAASPDLVAAARAFGYRVCLSAKSESELRATLSAFAEAEGPVFIAVSVNADVRSDLGRPTTTPRSNMAAFMETLAR